MYKTNLSNNMHCQNQSTCEVGLCSVGLMVYTIDREFGFYEFFSFLKFYEFYEFFFRLKKIRKQFVILQIIDV